MGPNERHPERVAVPTASNLELLFPRPQRLERLGGSWQVPRGLTLRGTATPHVAAALGWLREALSLTGRELHDTAPVPAPDPSADLLLAIDASAATPQSYALRIYAGSLSIVAGDAAGLQYGLCTLVQLIELGSPAGAAGSLSIPELRILDQPDFAERGVLLDVSRDKVPSLDTLRALIDRLARWKLNQLQLYMEHTFAYPGHDVVWQHASAYTAEEIRELDAHAAERHLELVPNQNSFGHLHRWLVHEPYRALAECPDGFEHPWNWNSEPYGLCPTDPGSLAFLKGLYDQLLPHFRSRKFNVGLDETIDLGFGRSKQACAERGTERVYLDFLRQVHALVAERGHVMQFWGDIINKRPELIPELPRGAVALEWGYEAEHPFAEHLARFQSAGLAFYVCPGTSSWNSIGGRTENAIGNLARAAEHGKAAGALGYLNTDWGDHGHLQPLSVSYLGLLLGAGFSWNVADARRPSELDVPALLDAHAFRDPAGVLGQVAYDLGNSYRETGSLRGNASVLFWMLIRPERVFSPAGVTRETLERTLHHIERSSAPLASAQPLGRDGALIRTEMGWVRDVLRFACRLGIARTEHAGTSVLTELPAAARSEFVYELEELTERHRAQWLARNRPGGLDDSARHLEQLRDALRGP